MNKKLLAKIAQSEIEQRNNEVIPDILKECLPYQLEFIKDPSKRKVVCSTRRSAKTFCGAIYMVDTALKIQNAKIVYLTLTNESAKRIIWSSIIETICIKYNIKAELNSKNEIKFNNGSIIYLVGLDATPKQKNRLRGNAFDLCIIDEAQDFTQDLKDIYQGVLQMTLAQTNATCCIFGTPGNQMGYHYFWLINKPDSKETEWKKYFFDWRNNTSIDPKSNRKVCDTIQEEINKDLERNPLIALTEQYRREVLGEWVIETDARVYKSTEKNYIKKLPDDFLNNASFILSCDLGYHDATAFVVSAYNKRYSNNMYVLESSKHNELTITAVANLIKEYRKRYTFKSIIVDAANTQAVEEMRQIHNLPLIAAEKLGKEAHITLLNSDFITQNVFILEDLNQHLIDELSTLIWDQRALLLGRHKEDATKQNHLTDALLYAHHGSRHYWYKPKPEVVHIEEAVVREIEKQCGISDKPKMKYMKKAFWLEDDDAI
jgi:hypothetical protein